jgi:flagellar motor protein MotB
MSWIIKTSTSVVAAGAILLSAGCSSKKDVAIASKDDTIRRQEAEIASAEASRARADEEARAAAQAAAQNAEVNRQLAAQNNDVLLRQQETQRKQIEKMNEQTQRIGLLTTEVSELDGIVKNMPKNQPTVVISQPGPIQEGQGGNVYKNRDGSIHIQVAGSVLFEPGRAELRSSAAETLSGVARSIRSRYPNNAIRIEGHTDSTPVVHARDRYPDNMALSQARAAAVYDFLGKHGVSNRMYTAGYGDRQPLVSPEKTASDRSKNRRVEIVILPTNLNVHKEMLSDNGSARPFRASEEASTTPAVPAKKSSAIVAASAPATVR